MKHIGRWLTPLLMLTITTLACSLGGSKEGDQETGGDKDTIDTTSQVYTGMNLSALDAYTATFDVTFTPTNDSEGWTYHQETRVDGSTTQHNLSIGGVSGDKNPGDVTLLMLDGTQYMTGAGVDAFFTEGTCMVAPSDFDIGTSFLTPDLLLPPETIDQPFDESGGKEVVSDVSGRVVSIEGGNVADYADVILDIVIAEEGDYVLSYTFEGVVIDDHFTDGLEGRMTWDFQITGFQPTLPSEVPAGCAIPYPLLDDANQIAWLGPLISYHSAHSREEAISFYQENLPSDGWEVYRIPDESAVGTILTYANTSTGEVLNVSVVDATEGEGIVVTLLLE